MKDLFINDEIKKALSILKPDNQLFEVRVLQGKKTLSGYFKEADDLIEAFKTVDLRGTNVYFTLNFINEACYSRVQHNRFVANSTTTSDSDIYGYQWMLIDFDPNRASGVSSSEEELNAAGQQAGKVYRYLKDLGFEEPIKGMSGNGYHLLYRINLKNTEENSELVHRCLEVIAELFNNDLVKIDTVNYNPSRICKLYGTIAQKGADTKERPHRLSFVKVENIEYKPTDIEVLNRLCEQLPMKPVENRYERFEKNDFKLEDFLYNNGITYKEMSNTGRDSSIIYALDECPFDSNHKNGDAKIFKYPDGRISFKCHHNSCSKYRWQDLRKKFEPDAYDHKEIDKKYEDGWKKHNKNRELPFVFDGDPAEEEVLFRNAKEIYKDAEPDHEFVKSGIEAIDKQLHGLEKQCVSLISGLRASGKSTLLGTLALQAVEDGHTVVIYSGELANKKYLNWILRQAAGKNYVEVSTTYQNGIGVPKATEEKIVDWLGDKFWLYNNKHGNNFRKISSALRTILVEKKADLCIIDNLMALDLSGFDKDKYEAQTQFVLELKEIAIQTNTHIVCVAHPRKTVGFLRLDDISGSGNIANAVDNAFMVHRVNLDFESRFKETIDKKGPSAHGIDENATNVIEIAKDRESGTMDFFIPLYFEPKSKRLMNSKFENVNYGWEDKLPEPNFYEIKDTDDWELPF